MSFDLLIFLLTALKILANALRCLRFSPCEQKKIALPNSPKSCLGRL